MNAGFSKWLVSGLAAPCLLVGCGSMLESPDDWVQAPMPGESSQPAAEPKKKETPESKPEEKKEPEVEKPAEPKVEEPAPPKVEEPAPPKVEEPAPPKVEESAPPSKKEPVADQKKGDYPTATRVKGFGNFVKSPYNDRWVKVKGIPSGSLVADPRFPIEEKKYFRVP